MSMTTDTRSVPTLGAIRIWPSCRGIKVRISFHIHAQADKRTWQFMTKCGKLSVSIERSWLLPWQESQMDAVAILRITGAYPAYMRPRKQTPPSSLDENMDDILEQLTGTTMISCAKLPTSEDNNLFSGTLSKQWFWFRDLPIYQIPWKVLATHGPLLLRNRNRRIRTLSILDETIF